MQAEQDGVRSLIAERLRALDDRTRCLILANPDVEHLADAAEQIAEAQRWPRLSVGSALSRSLRGVAPRQRVRAAEGWGLRQLANRAPGPVVLTEIDLLFEPRLDADGLRVNPVELFVRASRATRIVVAWPGTWDGETLAYAVPGHDHHRTWRRPDALVVVLP